MSDSTRYWLDIQGRHAATGGDPIWPEIHVGSHVYGWFFYADENPHDDWPADVQAVMRKARELGCEYVMLDADGPEIEGLPTFEW